MATFFVTTVQDNGDNLAPVVGSLREAIILSNRDSVPDLIAFNLASNAPFTIAPPSQLPDITAPLTIDGTTQPGFAGKPIVEISGARAGGGFTSGLMAISGDNTIRGLVINRFTGPGIHLLGPRNKVEGNYVGTDVSGVPPDRNRPADSGNLSGILIENTSGNTIGGPSPAMGNLISGNRAEGVFLRRIGSDDVAFGNRIQNNLIGTTANGQNALGNGLTGILILEVDFTADQRSLIEDTRIEDNVVAYNSGARIGQDAGGVVLDGGTGTLLAGNDIRDNQLFGVFLSFRAPRTTIGGTAAGRGNAISSNGSAGAFINASETLVVGNRVLNNRSAGVFVFRDGRDAIVGGTVEGARNVVSGNGQEGVFFSGDNGRLEGNYIGTDETGTRMMRNGLHGVAVSVGAKNSTIGGTAPGAGNLISGNGVNGIQLENASGNGTLVQGNRIGVDISGTKALGNGGNGIFMITGANTIGGTAAGAGNVISGNAATGVALSGAEAKNNLVQGDLIGVDVSGLKPLGNLVNGVSILSQSSGNTIGGVTEGARVVVSGNRANGVSIDGPNNLVVGTYVGVDASGRNALGNLVNGVTIFPDASGNTIGGVAEGARVVVSGNRANGVSIASPNNLVVGTYVGVDASGRTALGNLVNGVSITASGNTIGGVTEGARVVVSGNQANGVSIFGPNNLVVGTYIGVDVPGTHSLGNAGQGVSVVGEGNTIGGVTEGARVVVSGNQGNGVSIFGPNNRLIGSYIGVDVSGGAGLGNVGQGVSVVGEGNTIGGTSAGSRVVVSGNGSNGVSIAGSRNSVIGSYVGVDVSGTRALGNAGQGVNAVGGRNTIGGTTEGSRVVVSGNGSNGVSIAGPGNLFVGSYVGVDVSGARALGNVGQGVSVVGEGNTIGGTSAGSRVVVSGNGADGVAIAGTGNSVVGSYVGVDASGGRALGNAGQGVNVVGGRNTIGGTAPGSLVVVSGNGSNGVSIFGPGNLVTGSNFGVDVSGIVGLGNAGQGVNLVGGEGNTIGGASAGSGNIISANAGGISISQAAATVVQGNRIGVGADDSQRGNIGVGILISNSNGTLIGGTAEGLANVVAFSSTGIFVASGVNNTILGNRIFSNGLGVDIGPPGPTPNNDGGPREGANRLLNAPALSETATAGGRTTITGTYRGGPGATFLLEFFADVAQPTGFGQGRTLLGRQSVTTDGSGEARFTFEAATRDGQGPFVSATATDAAGDTSEFSREITEISYTATNTQDSGPGSLRQALLNATANPAAGVRRIRFAIPGQGPFAIRLMSPLPEITTPVEIDGFSQAGSRPNSLFVGDDGALSILLDGSGVATLANGLTLTSGGSTVRGLAIVRFRGNGIFMSGDGDNTIAGNFIAGNAGNGLAIVNSSGNRIGGLSPDLRNVISGNQLDGVLVNGAVASANLIVGNYIGTDPSGALAFGNAQDGVRVDEAGPSNAVFVNVISGNRAVGLEIAGISTSTAVMGNLIGTDASGASGLGNFFGVYLNAAVGNTIGGLTPAARNVVSGNQALGIQVFAIAAGGGMNAIRGNYIGTTADGMAALGNGDPAAGFSLFAGTGVFINNAANVTVGGTAPGAGNLISGNLRANVSVFGQANVPSVKNAIQGNIIGALLGRSAVSMRPTAADATLTQNVGVLINGSAGNSVGGDVAGAGNLIVGNLTGVEVIGISSTSNLVMSNVIDFNFVGVYLNNAVGDLVAGNAIAGNTTLGVTLIGTLASGNVVRANVIAGNGTAGVYLDAARDNTIGGEAPADSNLIADNGVIDPSRNGVGVYFHGGAVGNSVRRNAIRRNTAYGVFLFNAAGNVAGVARSGPAANRIDGNGIASFREYTGPETPAAQVPILPAARASILGKVKATPGGPKASRVKSPA